MCIVLYYSIIRSGKSRVR